MKTTPTDLDREAARLFKPAPGMRVFNADCGWGRVAEAAWAGTTLTHWSSDSMAVDGARVDAIDADDPATVGCMLAQVEQLATLDDIMDRWPDPADNDRWMLIATAHETQDTFDRLFAPTLGALMVAAMRTIKGAE